MTQPLNGGFHKQQCLECHHLEQEEHCTQECSANHYVGPDRKCHACHAECKESCHGPTSYDCNKCMNFKVFTNEGNSSIFNCTHDCPKEFPFQIYPHNSEKPHLKDPFCSTQEQNPNSFAVKGASGQPLMVGGIIGKSIF